MVTGEKRVERPELGILADDLTGAMDTGLQFAKHGRRTVVLLDGESDPLGEVLVLDADSRGQPEATARERVAGAARRLRAARVARVYKKVDSTGRGHLGAEIEVALETLGLAMALVCPAFPRQGRTVRGGCIYVRGIPLDQSEFARDPLWPATTASLVEILRRQTAWPVHLVPLSEVRRGPRYLRDQFQRLQERGVRLVIGDAELPTDLRGLIEAIHPLEGQILPVGSAGLAEALGEILDRPEFRPSPIGLEPGSVLVVAGTMNRVGRGQVARLVAAGAWPVALSVERALKDPDDAAGAVAPRLAAALDRDHWTVLTLATDDSPESDLATLADRAGIDQLAATSRLVRALGEGVRQAITGRPLAALVLTGGETARAVCAALGAGALEVIREVAPGIPLGRLQGGMRAGLPVVTKAGGFGDAETLVTIVRELEGLR